MQIRGFKLASGEFLVAEVVEETDNSYKLKKPMLLEGKVMIPWLYPALNDGPSIVELNKDFIVIGNLELKKQVEEAYMSSTSNITVARTISAHPQMPRTRCGGGPGILRG